MTTKTRGKVVLTAMMPLPCALLGCPLFRDTDDPGVLPVAVFPEEGASVVVGAVRFLWVAHDSTESTIRISKEGDSSFTIERTINATPEESEYFELIQIPQPGRYTWFLEITDRAGNLHSPAGGRIDFTVRNCDTSLQCQEQDGVFCNGAEVCVTGECQAGVPPDCSDGIACTQDACDPAIDGCTHTPDNSLCDDNLFCNGLEVCDSLVGCLPDSTPTCDDGVACTGDFCDEDTDACTHIPDHSVCDNGLVCDGTEICDLVLDCRPGTPPNCDDGLPCTADGCNSGGCFHSPFSCSQSSDCPGFDPACDGNSCVFCDESGVCVCPLSPRPDLTVVIDQGSINGVCPGASCVTTANVTFINGGDENAGPFNLQVDFDSGTEIRSVPGLAAGASATITVSTTPGNNCFDPDCTICATVDSSQSVLESDESNNQSCVTEPG